MQYTVSLTIKGIDAATNLGTFYVEDKANRVAKAESRKASSPVVLVVIEASERKRGYPKVYRMGRLYRP